MTKRHEQLLFRYSSALERGDFEAVAEVLREAERDPLLEQMVLDMNAIYAAEQSNHTNVKEVAMIATLYQKRSPQRQFQSQSLPLAVALAVIAILVVLLAMQTRSNSLNSAQPTNSPLLVAQNNVLCQATTLVAVNVISTPWPAQGVVVGTIPAKMTVQLLDEEYFSNDQRDEILWYFITSQGVEGWTSAITLDLSACPRNQLVQPATIIPAFAPSNTVATTQAAPLHPTALPSGVIASGGHLYRVYTVREGDTLLAILRHFNLDERLIPEILQINRLSSDEVLQAGMPILLPVDDSTSTPGVAIAQPALIPPSMPTILPDLLRTMPPRVLAIPALPEATAVTPEVISVTSEQTVNALFATDFTLRYIVQPGDTLSSLIERFNLNPVKQGDLLRLNGISVDMTLVTGSILLVPNNQTMICQVNGILELRAQPSVNAPIILTLPKNTDFRILNRLQQPDAAWDAVALQVGGVVLSGAWMRPDTVADLVDCHEAASAGTTITAQPIEVATPNAALFSPKATVMSPTAVPPSTFTPTPAS